MGADAYRRNLEGILRDLRKLDPWEYVEYIQAVRGAAWVCKFCKNWTAEGELLLRVHLPICVWKRAEVVK